MKFKIEFMFIMLLIKIIKIFPEKTRFTFAAFLGRLTYKYIKKRREISLLNLKLVFPGMKENDREKIAIKALENLAKSMMSTIWFDEYLKKEGRVSLVNTQVVDIAMNAGKGAVFGAMHLGNMEASVKIAEKYHVVTVAKKQKNPYLDDYITKNRKKLNITLLKRSKKTGHDLIQLLGKNHIIALFCDHRDGRGNIEFFGKQTTAPTGPVSIALRNKIPLFLVYNILSEDNTSTSYVSDEIELLDTGNFKTDLQENLQRFIYRMEEVIKKYPEQWMWCHDRWNIYKDLKQSKINLKGR